MAEEKKETKVERQATKLPNSPKQSGDSSAKEPKKEIKKLDKYKIIPVNLCDIDKIEVICGL